LVHPRVREQQGRVVRRHDRARGDDRVFLRFEEAEETLTDFGRFHRCPVPSTLICWEKSDSTEIGAKKWRPGRAPEEGGDSMKPSMRTDGEASMHVDNVRSGAPRSKPRPGKWCNKELPQT